MPQAAPQYSYGFPSGHQRRNSALVWSLEGYVPFETSSVRGQETWDSLYAQRGFLCCDLRHLRLRLASVERDLYNLRRKYRKCSASFQQFSTVFNLSDHSYRFTRSPDYDV